jgi:hypothetical protein
MPRDIQLLHVFYGDRQLTDPKLLGSIHRKISSSETLHVTNDTLGGDPKPGVIKDCTIDWRDSPYGPHLRQTVREPHLFDFSTYVSRVKYGGVELVDKPEVFERLNRAMNDSQMAQSEFHGNNKGLMRLDNAGMGGDTNPGHVKEVRVEIRDRSDEGLHWHTYKEGDLFPRL